MGKIDVTQLRKQLVDEALPERWPNDPVAHCPCCDRWYFAPGQVERDEVCTVCGNEAGRAREVTSLLYEEVGRAGQAGDRDALRKIADATVGMICFRALAALDRLEQLEANDG